MPIKITKPISDLRTEALIRLEELSDTKSNKVIRATNLHIKLMRAIKLIVAGNTTGTVMTNLIADFDKMIAINSAETTARQSINAAVTGREIHDAIQTFKTTVNTIV